MDKNTLMLNEAQRIAQIGCWELDLVCDKLAWSDEIFRLFEIDPEKFSASYEAFLDVIHPEDRVAVDQAYTESLKQQTPYEIEHRLLMPDGRIKYVLERGETEYDAEGHPLRSIGTVQNITERRLLEEQLSTREQESLALVENSPDTIARYDRDCRRTYANQTLARLMGQPIDDLLGVTPSQNMPGSPDMQAFEDKLWSVLASGNESEYQLTWSAQGKLMTSHIRIVPEWNKEGEVSSVLTVGRDITDISKYRHEIHRLAFFDSLTGLPNRDLFNERLRQVLENAQRHGYLTCLMLLDLDHFKVVNDSLGHPSGDQLLQEVATRLNKVVRDYDTVARLGGDEFALLLPEIRNEFDVTGIANTILGVFVRPFILNGRELFLTPSIGIALSPTDCDDSDDLFKCADSALYHAKNQGRNCSRLYSTELTHQARERLEIEALLRKAKDNNELELFYQPQFDLGKKRLIGAEALLRWRNPERGMIMPDQFIGIAEDTGLIVDIGEWVMREACKAVVEWNRQWNESYRVAVNVSTRQFHINDLIATVKTILAETGCRPQWLELEITESLLLSDNIAVSNTLDELNDMGITLAIDDFGTGYSALGYLNRYPIQILKIDRSFINGITTESHNVGLVKAIIAMAYSLKLRLVAEGVETPEHDELLQAWGCHMGQGYLYGRPLPLDEFAQLLREAGEKSATQVRAIS